jgi:hypothetical protein
MYSKQIIVLKLNNSSGEDIPIKQTIRKPHVEFNSNMGLNFLKLYE